MFKAWQADECLPARKLGPAPPVNTACQGLLSWARVRFPLTHLLGCVSLYNAQIDNCLGRPAYVIACSLTHPESSKPRAEARPSRKCSLTFSGICTPSVKSLFLFPCALSLIPLQQLLHLIIIVAVLSACVTILSGDCVYLHCEKGAWTYWWFVSFHS